MKTISKINSIPLILFALIFGMTTASAQTDKAKETVSPITGSGSTSVSKAAASKGVDMSPPETSYTQSTRTSGYVAKNESIQSLFNALSSEAKKPFVLSKLAQKKTITGDFDISNPYRFLDKISSQIGLAWYDDGQTIYVYDSSELKNSVVMMRSASLSNLNDFLERTKLISRRYPIRGEPGTGTFYVAGPPVYVDLVVNAAQYMDDLYKNVDLNKQKIKVIQLQHTFVGDRSYKVRDQDIKIGGIGKVIEAILANEYKELVSISEEPSARIVVEKDPFANVGGRASALANMDAKANAAAAAPDRSTMNQKSQIKVIAYQDTNSLLVKGTAEQVDLITNLIKQLDVPKRHIELSLWIIDIKKSALDQLGVQWQASARIGSKGTINYSQVAGQTPLSTLNGFQFIATVSALKSKDLAEIVSRPVILTQDNVPAIFDSNSTFYTPVNGERVASLDSVTYGTMINVLPRFSKSGNEVEMMLDIQDGRQSGASGLNGVVSNLPVITNVKISTVARVPKGQSLLIGGYTNDNYTKSNNKIPLLGDLPLIGTLFRSTSESVDKVVRLYLIQPKLLDFGSKWDAKKFSEPPMVTDDSSLKDTVDQVKDYSGAFDNGNY